MTLLLPTHIKEKQMKIQSLLEAKYMERTVNCVFEDYVETVDFDGYKLKFKYSIGIKYAEGSLLYPETREDPAEYEDDDAVGFCDYDNEIELIEITTPEGEVVKDYYRIFIFNIVDDNFDEKAFADAVKQDFADDHEDNNQFDKLFMSNIDGFASLVTNIISSKMNEYEKDFVYL